MGATVSAIKTLLIPALIALFLFVLINFAIVPAWRFYRGRYGHYVPVEEISSQTLSLGYRMHVAIGNFFSRAANATSTWRDRGRSGGGNNDNGSNSGGLGARLRGIFGGGGRRQTHEYGEMNDDDLLSEDGEELGTIRGGPGAHNQHRDLPPAYDERRLSRELEQGFMDDSEDEDDHRR